MGRTVQAGIAAAAVPLSRPRRRRSESPDPLRPGRSPGHPVAPAAGGRAGQSVGRARRLPRLPVHRSPRRKRHQLQVPHRGRRRQGLQGGALRSRDRDRDCRRRRRRPPRHLLRQPGGRQPVVAESRRREVREHHGVGRRGGRGQGQRLGLVRRYRQRRRRGSLRDHRPRRQHALRERRQGALQGHLRSLGAQLHGALVSRGLLRLRPRRQARSVPGQRRAVHDQHDRRRGRREVLRRVRGRLLRTSPSGTLRSQHPLPQRRKESLRGRLAKDGAPRSVLVGRRERGGRQRRRLARSLRAEHARRRPLLRERRRHALRGQEPPGLPEDPVGLDGHQGVRLQQRREDGHLPHRHALRHERHDRPGSRQGEGEVDDEVAGVLPRRPARPASGATPSSSRTGPASSTKHPTRSARRTTVRGARASATSMPTASTTPSSPRG